MTTPEQPDPRRRRWTILLVLLAIVVVAGVALRTVADGGGDADRTSDRQVETSDDTSGDDDAAAGEDAEDGGDATAGSEDDPAAPSSDENVPSAPSTPATESPLSIRLATITDAEGDPAIFVQQLGPLVIDGPMTLPAATARLGEPDSTGASADDPNVCTATWVAAGIDALFYFGHPASIEASCDRGPIAAAVLAGERWSIAPLTGEDGAALAVGDPEAAVTTAFPLATRQQLPPALATLASASEAWLLAEGSYGGDPFPTLYAVTVDGAVASFVYVSGAD